MNKPKKAHTNHLRLDIESRPPSVYLLERQLEEARVRRSCVVDLPWTTDKPAQLFTLSCEWNINESLPLWTLTEQVGQESRIVWSRAYAPSDILALHAAASACEPGSSPGTSAPIPAYDGLRGSGGALQIVPGTAFGGITMPTPSYPYSQTAHYPQESYSYPYYSYPAPSAGGMISSQATALPSDTGWSYPNQAQLEQSPAMNIPPMPVDYDLISKKAKLQLGKLLRLAGLIAEPTLEAALKVQELTDSGLVSQEEAPSLLARHHLKGKEITSFISGLNDGSTDQNAPIGLIEPHPQLKGPFDLLVKIGVLTDEDIKAAQSVKAKFGGDLVEILQFAEKLNKAAFDAAKVSVPLVREGLMKLDACGDAIKHCRQHQVDFDTALDTLGWPNPRKIRKDLKL